MDEPNPTQAPQQPHQPAAQAPEPEGQWQYNPDTTQSFVGDEAVTPVAPGSDAVIEWTASEFIAHERTMGWYGSFAGITLVVIALIYIITRDVVSVVVIALLAIIIGFGVSRQPKVVSYRLDSSGLSVGQKRYAYKLFKAFSVAQDGAILCVTFAPFNRFTPPLSIYFPPEDEEKILEILSNRLPLQPASQDWFDSIIKHARF